MKVVKHSPHIGQIFIGTCQKCECVVEATRQELNHLKSDQFTKLHSWEICPKCNAGDPVSGYGGICFQPKPEISND